MHTRTYIHIWFVSSSTNKNTYIFLSWNLMKFLIPTTTLPRSADAYNPYMFIAETLTRMCPALSYSILREAGFFQAMPLETPFSKHLLAPFVLQTQRQDDLHLTGHINTVCPPSLIRHKLINIFFLKAKRRPLHQFICVN